MSYKKLITFKFDDENLLELRKQLFTKGINPQAFFDYIINLVCFRDGRIEELMNEAAKERQERIVGTKEKMSAEERAENIYALIEQQLKQKDSE